MITLDILLRRHAELDLDDLRRWLAEGLVRPEIVDGELAFGEIDAERVRLILDLRYRMAVNEESLPVVLALLDQLYAMRRRLRRLGVPLDDA